MEITITDAGLSIGAVIIIQLICYILWAIQVRIK